MKDDALKACLIIYGSVAFATAMFLLVGCNTKGRADLPWRSDMATIQAKAGVVAFETRNVESPRQMNADGGCEWIIARIEGRGFDRLLLMTMCGGRPSRIYFQSGGRALEIPGRFPAALPGPSKWKVEATGGRIAVYLDGREIWSQNGKYHVDRAVMNGYAKRGMKGEWR
jgi:hypothetical protein